MLSAGKPVLFATGGLSHLNGKSIVVAWKDSRESRRAVADAMPFLRRADNVVVATIEESNLPDAKVMDRLTAMTKRSRPVCRSLSSLSRRCAIC